MTKPTLSAVFTDLDGTLLNSDRKVSEADLACLHELGKEKTVRVIATGRSLYSFNLVMPEGFPADFLIFSSGAGMIHLESGKLLYKERLKCDEIERITATLDRNDADYMVHFEVPENHRFVFRRHNPDNPDYTRRIDLYREHATVLADAGTFPETGAQVIAILPEDTACFSRIKSELNGYQVTRTTSPLDHRSIWMEIYPAEVHKGSGAAWLCDHLGLDAQTSVGIGNDYNDLDLLDFTPHSYVVAGAPAELQTKYRLTRSNDENGFSHAVYDAQKRIQAQLRTD